MKLTKYLILLFFFSPAYLFTYGKKITVMVNPGGDAQNAGREFAEGMLERGITLQCCEYIKKALEATYSGIRIILTRIPGEVIQPLQNASFANRLGADLYLSIHFFEKKQGRPQLHLYHYCLNSTTDTWNKTFDQLNFVPYSQAYIENLSLTKQITTTMAHHLQKEHAHHFDTHHPLGIPFAPLIGIKAPAIGLEMSLKKSDDWHTFATALIDSVGTALTEIKKRRWS